jgi:hypothetical protein
MTNPTPSFSLMCFICKKPVPLPMFDDNGKAVHEECHVAHLKESSPPQA